MKDIKQELEKAGVTQLSIAKMLKIKAPSVHNVITGKRKTPRIRTAISLAINKPVSDIWPEISTKEETA